MTDISDIVFRNMSEEVVLEMQRQYNAAEFQLGVLKQSHHHYAAEVQKAIGKKEQAEKMYNYVKALYECAVTIEVIQNL